MRTSPNLLPWHPVPLVQHPEAALTGAMNEGLYLAVSLPVDTHVNGAAEVVEGARVVAVVGTAGGDLEGVCFREGSQLAEVGGTS